MSITIEGCKTILGGNTSSIVHNSDNTVWMFTENEGKFKFATGNVPLGVWDNVKFELNDTLIRDNEVKNIRCKSITNVLNLIVWNDGSSHRILVFPSDSPMYDPTSVNRLYWAVDSEKLYMNISDTWQMIGTLNHSLMNGSGKYSHDTVDIIIEHLCNKLEINIDDLVNK